MTSVPFKSRCARCEKGLMSVVKPLDREERIEERCGRLLLVSCSAGCGNRQWAHRWDGEPMVDFVTGRCGHCGGAHPDEHCWRKR
jgi:hypothetical protein